ncbi:hypothetical protein [Pyxidicoccus xibeiensis]|uniref:hypothetical protein n=1 Tax=Pyxidicoccus xibeiensis TaxID=2906759 RepID=UPI0020A74683|nr:hypothetical protein [Pyxidicoccus xibeiensis]MCP3137234.1 hypothetical protein [Pyxidicoccus xibeiensis]
MGVLQEFSWARAAVLAVGLVASGCDNDLEKQSQVTRVRVLAVRATPAEWVLPPEGGAPQSLGLEALAVAPDARPLTVTFALCRPGNVYAADFQCPGRDGVELAGGVLSPDAPEVEALLEQMLGGTDVSDPAVRSRLEAGVPFYVGYEVSDGSGTPEGGERGLRRLTARLTDAPNQNPRVTDVLYQGESLVGPLPVGTEVALTPVLAEDSQERYPGPQGEVTEAVSFAWHATGTGEVEFFRSVLPAEGEPGEPGTEYTTPATPQQVTLYVVARDGRGGTDWLVRTVEVR